MNCPDCKEKMESEDASSFKDERSGNTRIIACNYFCLYCQEYFRWIKGERLQRVSTGAF